MTQKKRRLFVIIAIAVILCIFGLSLLYRNLFSVDSLVSSTSPDGLYTAKITSNFSMSSNYFDIKVEDHHDTLVRHLSVHDKLPGWATDPSATWSSDSKVVTVGLQDPDAGMAMKTIDIIVP